MTGTVTERKAQAERVPDEIVSVIEPTQQYHCDSCCIDLTHAVRIKCADPTCDNGLDSVDLCPSCFCAGKEFGNHKKGHAYRVIEINSYPVFTEDWGADEELSLLTGTSKQGLGNWKKIAEHIGTRTKEEVETHYRAVYIDSPSWPLPRMDAEFDIDPEEFQARKRRRITEFSARGPPSPGVSPVSAPGVHEIFGFFPGRLEFEHEPDNDAENLIKELEIGYCLDYDGDTILEDDLDQDVKARAKILEERQPGYVPAPEVPVRSVPGKGPPNGALQNGFMNGFHGNGSSNTKQEKPDASVKSEDADEEEEEATLPPPFETPESLQFKLSMLEMYNQRVERRAESKSIIFERGLLEFKKMQAADKKRPREERDIINRLRSFSRLQTAADYEVFAADTLYEAMLRKRIQELQTYRRLGLQTPADIEKYNLDLSKRVKAPPPMARDYTSDRLQARAGGRQASTIPDTRRSSVVPLGDEGRKSHERETTPRPAGTGPPLRRQPQPLNLANSPSLHLLTSAEQALCSQLRILPKPYLVIKETLVREYARRGGKLRRREARDLVKIDVNKTSRVWDFLVSTGMLKITAEPTTNSTDANAPNANGSPVKDVASRQGSVVVNGAPISVNGNALPQAAGALS